jgi:predicted alpha/beta superfamily hydrolase
MPPQTSPTSMGPVVLRETDTYRFDSPHVGAELEVRVARPLPGAMGPLPDRYAVLYVTDGDLFFGMATEITRLRYQLFGELPPLLVVGIGYGTNDARVQGETRNRDLTPTADPGFIEMGRRINPSWEPLLPEGRRMGRADELLTFVERELQPYLAGRYPVADDGSVLFGSSLGGLFANYALLTRPGLFDGYVIVSPSLWWDREVMFRIEAESAAATKDLVKRVYLAVGEYEEGSGIPGLDEWKLVTNTQRMAEVLEGRNYPSLNLTYETLPGETHTAAASVGMTRGLSTVLGRQRRP